MMDGSVPYVVCSHARLHLSCMPETLIAGRANAHDVTDSKDIFSSLHLEQGIYTDCGIRREGKGTAAFTAAFTPRPTPIILDARRRCALHSTCILRRRSDAVRAGWPTPAPEDEVGVYSQALRMLGTAHQERGCAWRGPVGAQRSRRIHAQRICMRHLLTPVTQQHIHAVLAQPSEGVVGNGMSEIAHEPLTRMHKDHLGAGKEDSHFSSQLHTHRSPTHNHHRLGGGNALGLGEPEGAALMERWRTWPCLNASRVAAATGHDRVVKGQFAAKQPLSLGHLHSLCCSHPYARCAQTIDFPVNELHPRNAMERRREAFKMLRLHKQPKYSRCVLKPVVLVDNGHIKVSPKHPRACQSPERCAHDHDPPPRPRYPAR